MAAGAEAGGGGSEASSSEMIRCGPEREDEELRGGDELGKNVRRPEIGGGGGEGERDDSAG